MSDLTLDFNASTLDKIYPYVVPRSWVDHVDAEHVISVPFSDDVFMVLVVDGQGTVRNVRPEDLDAVHVLPEEAIEIATNNLGHAWQTGQFQFGTAELLDGKLVGASRGGWMAPAGALMLGNFYQMMVDAFGQHQFAAVAVNQQFLIAFPADEETLASNSLRLAIDEEFTGHHKPISRSWLLLNGDWPSAYPSPAAF